MDLIVRDLVQINILRPINWPIFSSFLFNQTVILTYNGSSRSWITSIFQGFIINYIPLFLFFVNTEDNGKFFCGCDILGCVPSLPWQLSLFLPCSCKVIPKFNMVCILRLCLGVSWFIREHNLYSRVSRTTPRSLPLLCRRHSHLPLGQL